ncbi:hypothetical protein O988_03479 [Pseudogymnoascus sp. VKM F-3808]|nr:hypothetical protein O988_03479 [Pseudogymnoascus sp. VKM F-3808]
MDPISIAASSASLAVFCVKVAAAVYTITDSVRNVDTNVSGLHQELVGFSGTLNAIEKTWKQNTTVLMAYSGPDAALWTSVTENLDNSKSTLEMLEKALTNVKKGGFFGQGILSKPTKAAKLSLSMADITAYQHRINSHHIAMQGGLQMISLCLHIQGNASLQSLDTSLASLGDLIKLISQRADTALQGIKNSGSDPSQVDNESGKVVSGLQSMARAANSVFTSASTVIDGRRSTIYEGSVVGEGDFYNDGGRVWGGSVLGTPLTEEQYSGIENWIPPPTKAKDESKRDSSNLPATNNSRSGNADFLGKAINAVKEAIALDNAKDYEKAYKQYYICLELFMLAIKFEKNPESKRIMQNKAAEYMDRAEKLKSYLQTQASAIPIRKAAPIVSRSPSNPGIPLVLPPGTSTKKFDDYIVQAENICGVDNVKIITKAEETYKKLLKALDMLNLNNSDRDQLLLSAVVRPRKESEAQEIVRLCNTFEIPVWSFSGVSEVDYRAAIPRVPGSIGLDFGCYMNKVLGVNELRSYVVVEPGATYSNIYWYLQDNNLDQKFEIDLPLYMGGLALGNIVEDSTLKLHCGKEVILPNGDILKTGSIQLSSVQQASDGNSQAEQPETKEKQTLNFRSNELSNNLLPEGGLGITVKLAICITPKLGGCQPYQITFPKDNDLSQIIDITRELRQAMIIQSNPSLRHVLLDAAILGPKSSYATSNTPLGDAYLDGVTKDFNSGRWNFYGAVRGPEHIRNALWQIIKEVFSQIEGASFYFSENTQQENSLLFARSKQLRGNPTTHEIAWTKWIPNGSHICFQLTSNISGDMANTQYSVTKKRIQEAGFDFMGTFTIDTRQMHHIIYIVYETYDADSRRKVHKLILQLMNDCAENGWMEYWTYGALMDQASAARDLTNNTIARINTEIKDVIDPMGILEPGRNGVWPTRSDKSVWKQMADRSLAE